MFKWNVLISKWKIVGTPSEMKCIKVCLYMKECLNLLHGICKEFSNLIQKTALSFTMIVEVETLWRLMLHISELVWLIIIIFKYSFIIIG